MQHIALIVDDDQHTLIFLEQVLRPLGVQILQAEDGAQAIDNLHRCTPSILFLDMLLPKVSGLEVLHFVLNTPRLNNMVVVVVSAHNHFPPSTELNRVDAYFVKPVRPHQIRDATQQAMARQIIP